MAASSMPAGRVLVTGGAGFIGSHTVEQLHAAGHRVRILDALALDIHGPEPTAPPELPPDAELLVGDISDAATVRAALDGVGAVIHLAAETSVGRSMLAPAQYVRNNVLGTAVLWEEIRRHTGVRRFVLASSRAVYGEGSYRCDRCGSRTPGPRRAEDLAAGRFQHTCATCGRGLRPVPTREDATLGSCSVYAATKRSQEELCRLAGDLAGIPVSVLRYFNVYGPRQALSNPYTGVLANFCARLLAGGELKLYEHGLPFRDFIHVRDVARANVLALETGIRGTFNIGTGRPVSLERIAAAICAAFGVPGRFVKTSIFRGGDILGCHADTARARTELGFAPEVDLGAGCTELVDWSRGATAVDRLDRMEAEFRSRGVLHG
jgi:dTDP-L-rhamnose 4-epimerase